MPLATTTGTPVVKTEPLSKYEIDRNERHATSQAGSNAKRKAKNAPRRDDMARAAYYALMMYYEEAGTAADKASFKRPFVNILVKAGFPREVCSDLFESHVGSLLDDFDGWLKQRWYAERQRLKDGRGDYVPLDRSDPNGARVGSKALTTVLEPSAIQSAAEQE
ncbi:hypothetical protein [Methylobacterium sp. WL116]|uniref:hypothetical protein n=1 Tax=Methylobacterium sp. WL116 TaxID=2603889 RepID=UPI0011C9B0C6|nr:hypothetical protein [Methylobacterium sp. WL116]TXM91173.1 hypothetical protein FV223_16035 [Methylobacterium sp. WL116]